MPTRGLIGYHGEFLTDTRGTGIMSRLFHGYAPYKGTIEGRAQRRADLERAAAPRSPMRCGTSRSAGRSSSIRATQVYEGMIIGEHSRGNDLEVNPLKDKAAHQHPHHLEGRGDPPDPAPAR